MSDDLIALSGLVLWLRDASRAWLNLVGILLRAVCSASSVDSIVLGSGQVDER